MTKTVLYLYKRVLAMVAIATIFGNLTVLAADSGATKAPPAEPVTLNGAVAYGLEHNRTLQAAGQEIQAADQGVRQAKADFLPKVDAGFSSTHLEDAPFARLDNMKFQTSHSDLNRWETLVTQPLFTGHALTAQYRSAKLQRDQATHHRETTRLDLIRNIQRAFLQALLAEKLLQVQGDTIRRLEAHRHDAQAYYQQGLTPRNDVLKADVSLADAHQKEQSATKQVRVLRSQLNQLLGLDLPIHLELAEWDQGPDPHQPEPDLAELYSRAEAQRPELLALQTAILQTEEGKRLAASRLYPQAALFGSYYREGKDFLATENDFTNENNAAVGVKVGWNWFDGGKTYAAIKEWRYRRRALEDRRQDAVRQIYVEVQDAHEQLRVSKTNLETARLAIEQARENDRITLIQYQQQIVLFSEVLDAQVYLTQAQVNYYQALYGCQLAWADLERAVGGALQQPGSGAK
jgi:outer membrane protein